MLRFVPPALALSLCLTGCAGLQAPPVTATPGYEATGHFRSTATRDVSRARAEVHDVSTVPVEDTTLSFDEPSYAEPSCPDGFVGSLIGTAIEAATGQPSCGDC